MKMETGWSHLGGSVEPSEGKGGECCGYFKVFYVVALACVS
jgi:hypothetical protein